MYWEAYNDLREKLCGQGYDYFSKSIFGSHYHRILLHNKMETDIHFMAKAMAGKILYEMRRPFVSEFNVSKNSKTVRSFDLLDCEEMNCYEFENNPKAVKADFD